MVWAVLGMLLLSLGAMYGARAQIGSDFENAEPIQVNSTVTGVLEEGESYYYQVTTTDGMVGFILTVQLIMPPNTDFDLYLYDDHQAELDYSWYDNPETVSTAVNYAGVYYIVVDSWFGAGNYTLWVNLTGDGDDSIMAAHILDVTNPASVDGNIDPAAGDEGDWYGFELQTGDVVEVSVTSNTPDNPIGAVGIYFYNNVVGLLNISVPHAEGGMVFSAHYTGLHYVLVIGTADTMTNYTLNVSKTGTVTMEGDEIPDNAAPLATNHAGYVNQAFDHYDWYSTTLTVTDTSTEYLQIEFSYVPEVPDAVLCVEIYDADMQHLDTITVMIVLCLNRQAHTIWQWLQHTAYRSTICFMGVLQEITGST